MALKRFRYEAEGVDQEDVERQLDAAFLYFSNAARLFAQDKTIGAVEIESFECTDDRITPINRNGVPMMYGRRVFRVVYPKKGAKYDDG
jgi:hypothetical protein